MSELSKTFKEWIRKLQPVDYFAAYECKVVVQYADGTVDLEPFDKRLQPGPTRVVIAGAAGQDTIKMQTGSRCMVSFRNGKPNAPFVEFWALDTHFLEVGFQADTFTVDAKQFSVTADAASIDADVSLGSAKAIEAVAIESFVKATMTVIAGLGAFCAAAAAVLPVLAPAAATLAPIITTYAEGVAKYTATRVKAT